MTTGKPALTTQSQRHEPRWMQEAELVREHRSLERDTRRQEDDDAHAREQRDAYYPAPTSEGSDG